MPNKKRVIINSPYLEKLFYTDKFSKTVMAVAERIRKFRKKNPFDAIAFTGVSGAGMAFAVSYKTKIPLICVRKRTDKSHSYSHVEGCISAERYIIIDDFISNGTTVRKIVARIKKELPNAKPVGVFLYDGHGTDRKIENIPLFRVKT